MDKATKDAIIESRIKALYGGKNSARTIKNQKPGKMVEEVKEANVQIVGLYSKLPKHLAEAINKKDDKKKLEDSKVMKELADFILKHDGIVDKTSCCFLDEKSREFLKGLSSGVEYTPSELRRYYKPRSWFYVSERQIYSKQA